MSGWWGWLLPSAGDYVALGVWAFLLGGPLWMLRVQRREERRREASRPLADRYAQDGWRP